MKWKRLLIIGVLGVIAIYIIVNIWKNNQKVDFVDTYNEGTKTKVEFATMQEIRASKDEVLGRIKDGEYENLKADNTNITIADCESISKLREYPLGLYKGIQDPKEMLDLHLEMIQRELGDVEDENISDMNSLKQYEVNNEIWADSYHLSELREMIENGTYDKCCELKVAGCSLPALQVSRGYQYMAIESDFNLVVRTSGKINELIDTEGLEEPQEPVAVYYPKGEHLEDTYSLYDGDITIGKAIEFVENYLNDKLPNDKLPFDTSAGAAKKVAKVLVFNLKPDLNYLEFVIVRELEGMVTEYSPSLNFPNGDYSPYDSRVKMIETGQIDHYYLTDNTLQWEKIGEEATEVVSLESAISQISDKIGQNSSYEIEEIDMAYRVKCLNSLRYKQEKECYPCWIVRCVNQTDKKNTVFYVDLFTGEVAYSSY